MGRIVLEESWFYLKKKKNEEKFNAETAYRKKNSVLCDCGHRIYFPKERLNDTVICKICGKGHITPANDFKTKLMELIVNDNG